VAYGYKLESSSPLLKEYVKVVDNCPITVAVFPTLIAFSIPYWREMGDALFEALQDASELTDSGKFSLFNPQENSWSDG